MISNPPPASVASSPLEVCVRSLASLVQERAQERDVAVLERDLARRERDTVTQMLSLTLTQLHVAMISNRRLQERVRQTLSIAPLGYLDGHQREDVV